MQIDHGSFGLGNDLLRYHQDRALAQRLLLAACGIADEFRKPVPRMHLRQSLQACDAEIHCDRSNSAMRQAGARSSAL